MNCKVVTVARTLQAGGEEVGRLVAEELGYRYVDDEIISKAAEQAGVSPEVVERAEHRQPLVARLLETMAATAPPESFGWGAYAMAQAGPQSYQDFIIRVIRETAEEGNLVLVAHGAGVCLAGEEGVLRVLVTASPDVRAGRLGGTEPAKVIAQSDGERVAFLRKFYGLKQEEPTHYDLVVSTDVLSRDAAARIVAAAAKAR
jgi:cytidylate kinase